MYLCLCKAALLESVIDFYPCRDLKVVLNKIKNHYFARSPNSMGDPYSTTIPDLLLEF